MSNKLAIILRDLGIISTNSILLFEEKSHQKEYNKLEKIFEVKEKNNMEYLLLSGILHRYNISEKGDIVTTGFYISPTVITPHFARTNKGKCIFSLQALTDTVVAEIHVKELDLLRNQNREFQEFGQRILETELYQTYNNEVMYRSFSGKERLLYMRKQFPNIENNVSHHIIASYLGITNVSLSRLRNELSKK